MRKSFHFCLIVLLVLGATALWAQQFPTYQRIVVADTAVGLSDATLAPAGYVPVTRCEGRVEDAQIRTLDVRAGTVGATTGRLLEVGDIVTLSDPVTAASARFAKTGSTTGTLYVECWR